MTPPSSPRYQKSKNVICRKIGDETILVPLSQTGVDLQKVYLLNPTGHFVFNLLETPQTLTEIIEKTLQRYHGDKDIIENHVQKLLQDCIPLDFIVER